MIDEKKLDFICIFSMTLELSPEMELSLSRSKLIYLVILVPVLHCVSCMTNNEAKDSSGVDLTSSGPKLLIILIDGFRWDYFIRQKSQLPGLSNFVSDGVHAEWVDPIFPSVSFPSWTTIATGVYPEDHNILGNYMFHRGEDNDTDHVFQLLDNSTKSSYWWNYSAEPIWTTVTKQGMQVFLANWARCDVPIDGILPAECTGYVYRDINIGFRDDLQTALKRLRQGYSLAMVYDDFVDHIGHKFGPDSNELRIAMVQRDAQIQELLINIQLYGMTNKVHVIITSDHGMTALDKTVKRIHLDEYLNESDIYKVVDYGTVVGIAAEENRIIELGESLRRILGISVYSKSEIPEEFHYKKGRFVLDYLLVAQPGNYVVGLRGEKQIPNDRKSHSIQPYNGIHGYQNMTDMKTIFFAKGPSFKKRWVHQPIRLVDQYQIFMKILGIRSPHKQQGNWKGVEEMFE